MLLAAALAGVAEGGKATAPDPPAAKVGVPGVSGTGGAISSSMLMPPVDEMLPPPAPPRRLRAFFFWRAAASTPDPVTVLDASFGRMGEEGRDGTADVTSDTVFLGVLIPVGTAECLSS